MFGKQYRKSIGFQYLQREKKDTRNLVNKVESFVSGVGDSYQQIKGLSETASQGQINLLEMSLQMKRMTAIGLEEELIRQIRMEKENGAMYAQLLSLVKIERANLEEVLCVLRNLQVVVKERNVIRKAELTSSLLSRMASMQEKGGA